MQHLRKRQSSICQLRNLIHAIKSQDEYYIDSVITENLNINVNYFDEGTPLHVAARIGNYKIFQKLIKIGGDIHRRHPTTQETVLHCAVEFSNYDIAEYLIENCVDVNAKLENYGCINGETALHFAAKTGTKEIIDLLLSNNAKVHAESDNGIIPIISAIKSKNYDVISTLETHWPYIFWDYNEDGKNKTTLHAAVEALIAEFLISFTDKFDVTNINNNNNYNFSFFGSQRILHHAFSLNKIDEEILFYLLPVSIMGNFQDYLDQYRIFKQKYKSAKDLRCSLVIKWHNAKLTAADFYICDENISAIRTIEGLDDYIAKCLLEVEKMKKNMIEGTNIKFIEVLHKNVRYLAPYLKFVDFGNIFIRERRFPEYPIYQSRIFFKLSRAHIRVNYIKQSEEIINNIFYQLQLPYTFIKELYFFLSNEDLKEIIQPSRYKQKN